MSKHTPGPWVYKQMGTQVWGRSVGGCRLEMSDHLVADVRGWGHIQYLPNAEAIQDANGRLIASAPELLEALQRTVDALETVIKDAGGCDHSVGICMCDDIRIVADGRAAIAKATQ